LNAIVEDIQPETEWHQLIEDGRHKPDLRETGNETDVALEVWARWAKSALSGLGWSPHTLLARVIEFGVVGAASRAGLTIHPLEVDELCELVERGVMRLKEIERKVIVRRYLHWEPREVSARRCHMSQGRFATVLHRARRSIRDFLDGAKLHYTK
jgi:hypothetical protein